MIQASHIIIKGRVQGVGFRWFAREEARKKQICGYVKNLHDGNVEIIAEGEENALEAFIAIVSKGPPFSKVLDVDIQKRQVSGYSDFSVEF